MTVDMSNLNRRAGFMNGRSFTAKIPYITGKKSKKDGIPKNQAISVVSKPRPPEITDIKGKKNKKSLTFYFCCARTKSVKVVRKMNDIKGYGDILWHFLV